MNFWLVMAVVIIVGLINGVILSLSVVYGNHICRELDALCNIWRSVMIVSVFLCIYSLYKGHIKVEWATGLAAIITVVIMVVFFYWLAELMMRLLITSSAPQGII